MSVLGVIRPHIHLRLRVYTLPISMPAYLSGRRRFIVNFSRTKKIPNRERALGRESQGCLPSVCQSKSINEYSIHSGASSILESIYLPRSLNSFSMSSLGLTFSKVQFLQPTIRFPLDDPMILSLEHFFISLKVTKDEDLCFVVFENRLTPLQLK